MSRRRKDIPDAPVRIKNGRTFFRNTFGPPHVDNEWLTAANVLQGLQLGFFDTDKLPPNVLAGVLKIPRAGEDGRERREAEK